MISSDRENNLRWNVRTQRPKLSAGDRSNDAVCVRTKSKKIFYFSNDSCIYINLYIILYVLYVFLMWFYLLHAKNSQNKQIVLKNEWNDIKRQFPVSLLNCFTLEKYWWCIAS